MTLDRPSRRVRMVTLADAAGRAATRLPGLAAIGCAVAGMWLLVGVGPALLTAAAFLLLIDRRMP